MQILYNIQYTIIFNQVKIFENFDQIEVSRQFLQKSGFPEILTIIVFFEDIVQNRNFSKNFDQNLDFFENFYQNW